MSKWNGKCSTGRHGLDYEKQPCDLCAKHPAIYHGKSSTVSTVITVEYLIEQLQSCPPKAEVFVATVYGQVPPRAHLCEDGRVGVLGLVTMQAKKPEPQPIVEDLIDLIEVAKNQHVHEKKGNKPS